VPVRRGLPRTRPTHAPDLERRLAQELDSPSSEGQPLVFEEPDAPAPVTRLFVVWDDWSEMNQQDRSAIILNAYEQSKGKDAVLQISVAMGLTTHEAEGMGILSH
jgi:hypothetical protein